MLWYKAWLETRWKFLVGLVLGAGFAVLMVLAHPALSGVQVDLSAVPEPFREVAEEGLRLSTTYNGYVWSQWFGKNFLQTLTFFAVLIGVGGVVTESSRGSALWTLSLPVSRARLLGVRAAVGAVELLALAVLPSLLIPVLSPAVGQSYSVADALLYSLIAFAAGQVFYCLALLLSTVFRDQLKPLVLCLAAAFGMGIASVLSRRVAGYTVYAVMSGEKLFKEGALPWAGLAVCLTLAAAMFFVALRVLERRDF